MAFVASQFSLVKRRPVAAGAWLVTGKFTGPASYASGGEALTNAILKAALGINHIDVALFTPLVDPTNALVVQLVFDHNATASTQGKLRAFNSGNTAHTHSFLVKGGQAAAGTDAISIKGTTPVTIGKEAATDATNIGGAGGGVQLSTAVGPASEVTSTTDLSLYVCRFVIYGA